MTWAEVGVKNAGFRKTVRALRFAMAWGLATATLGHEPTSVEEYAEFWDESRATAFRDQQSFRAAFPTETTPARMNAHSGAQARYDEAQQLITDRAELVAMLDSGVFTLGAAAAELT
jgi:hypothetical protein